MSSRASKKKEFMEAIVKTFPEPNGTELKLVEVPKLKPEEVLIKTRVISICGTDLHIYNWDSWAQKHIKLPRIYGHEFAGIITELGREVKSLKKGDYVSGEGHLVCWKCFQCRTGLAHVCSEVKGLGVDVDGAFAEYLVLPASNVWRNDNNLSLEIASIQDPLGNATHAVLSTEIVGNTIAIFGCGPLGLMSISICKFIGASKVFAIGRKNIYRLKLAKKLGADLVLKSEEAVETILNETDGKGVDVVLEMAGNSIALRQGLKVLRSGGELITLGIYSEPVEINVSEDIVFKNVKLQGIYGRRMYETWYKMKGLLQAGLNLKPIITHKLKFRDFRKAFKVARSGNCGKVILCME
jgi:threonine 3-dehydrogenase